MKIHVNNTYTKTTPNKNYLFNTFSTTLKLVIDLLSTRRIYFPSETLQIFVFFWTKTNFFFKEYVLFFIFYKIFSFYSITKKWGSIFFNIFEIISIYFGKLKKSC